MVSSFSSSPLQPDVPGTWHPWIDRDSCFSGCEERALAIFLWLYHTQIEKAGKKEEPSENNDFLGFKILASPVSNRNKIIFCVVSKINYWRCDLGFMRVHIGKRTFFIHRDFFSVWDRLHGLSRWANPIAKRGFFIRMALGYFWSFLGRLKSFNSRVDCEVPTHPLLN